MEHMLISVTEKIIESLNVDTYFADNIFVLTNPELKILAAYPAASTDVLAAGNTVSAKTIVATAIRKLPYTVKLEEEFRFTIGKKWSICAPICGKDGKIIGYFVLYADQVVPMLEILADTIAKFIYEKFIHYLVINKLNLDGVELTRGRNLTTKEWQIIKKISEGKYDVLIAHELSVSKSTVRAHISNIFEKLKVQSRTEIIVYYYNVNLRRILDAY